MRKAVQRRFVLYTLPGLLLLAAFFIGERTSSLSTALAAGTGVEQRSEGVTQACTSSTRGPSFGADIVVGAGETVCGNITAFGGTIVIQGEVQGDIVAFGASVIIDGTVHGTISAYGGSITLHDNSSVYGDVHLCQGSWTTDNDKHLFGDYGGCPRSMDQILASDAGPRFRFWSALVWIVFGTLLIVLLPEHVMLVRTTAKSKARRSLVLGLLSILLALPVLAILMALIISIPLAIIVVVGLIAAWALGTVAVGSLLGEYIVHAVAPQRNTRAMQVVVGLTVLVLAGSLPYIGWLISIGVGLLGLGAVFLSRFGTRLYGQPKQPIML